DISLPSVFTYTLTMQAVRGDETANQNPPNAFGLIFCFNSKPVKGKGTVHTFYAFEVLNQKNGGYQFSEFDESKPQGHQWTIIWSANFGKEFKQGHGPKASNTVKIQANGSAFTFVVNNKAVKTVKDKSFKDGIVGMIVNLQGTEVAFSN